MNRVLVAHSRDGVAGSVIVGARLAKAVSGLGAWSATSLCNTEGPVRDYHARMNLDCIPLFTATGVRYRPDPTDGHALRRAAKRARLALAARCYLAHERPSLVHVHDESSAVAWGLACRGAGVPVIWHVHQHLPQRWTDPFLRGRMAHIILVAAANKARFDGKQTPDISVIYNGVDTDVFFPAPNPMARRRTVIGFISNLVERKRPEWLVRALGVLKREGIEAEALVAGNDFTGGRRAAALQALARHEGLEDRYRYLGFQSDVAALLHAIDILVLPSERDKEAFPLIILEAMACGVPVIATRVAATPEAVQHGETGELVEPDDFAGFLEALRKLVASPALRRAYSSAAADAAKRHFSLAASARQLNALYTEVARVGGRSNAMTREATHATR